jgi:hypothetical protein
MEKLLSTTKKPGGNHEIDVNRHRTKNIFLAIEGTKIFLATPQQIAKNKPYSG